MHRQIPAHLRELQTLLVRSRGEFVQIDKCIFWFGLGLHQMSRYFENFKRGLSLLAELGLRLAGLAPLLATDEPHRTGKHDASDHRTSQ